MNDNDRIFFPNDDEYMCGVAAGIGEQPDFYAGSAVDETAYGDRASYFKAKDERKATAAEEHSRRQKALIVRERLNNLVRKKSNCSGVMTHVEEITSNGYSECCAVVFYRVSGVESEVVKVIIPYSEFYTSNRGPRVKGSGNETRHSVDERIAREQQILAKHTRDGGLNVPFVILSFTDKGDYIECIGSRKMAMHNIRLREFNLNGGHHVGEEITATVTSVGTHSVGLTALGIDFSLEQYDLTFRWFDTLDYPGSPYHVGAQIPMFIQRLAYDHVNNIVSDFSVDARGAERLYFAGRKRMINIPARTDDAIITRIYHNADHETVTIYLYSPLLDIVGKATTYPIRKLPPEICPGERVVFRITGKSSGEGSFLYGFISFFTGDNMIFNTRTYNRHWRRKCWKKQTNKPYTSFRTTT